MVIELLEWERPRILGAVGTTLTTPHPAQTLSVHWAYRVVEDDATYGEVSAVPPDDAANHPSKLNPT
jgi:hypothetical protein